MFHTSFFSEHFKHNHWQQFMDNFASGEGDKMSMEKVKTFKLHGCKIDLAFKYFRFPVPGKYVAGKKESSNVDFCNGEVFGRKEVANRRIQQG